MKETVKINTVQWKLKKTVNQYSLSKNMAEMINLFNLTRYIYSKLDDLKL